MDEEFLVAIHDLVSNGLVVLERKHASSTIMVVTATRRVLLLARVGKIENLSVLTE